MPEAIEIRESVPADVPALELLYPKAFPDEDLLPLVNDLLRESPAVLSLVGTTASQLVGHVIFTRCSVGESPDKAALLAPLAVAPAWQRQGIGSAIVRAGLRRLEEEGICHVYVLGDPTYYRRFGFVAESRIEPPYPLPSEWQGAWQSMSLGAAASPRPGKILLPQPWLQPDLWAPVADDT